MIPIYRAVFPHGNGEQCEDYRDEICYSPWYFDENLAKLHLANAENVRAFLKSIYGRYYSEPKDPYIETSYVHKSFLLSLNDTDLKKCSKNYREFSTKELPYPCCIDKVILKCDSGILLNVQEANVYVDVYQSSSGGTFKCYIKDHNRGFYKYLASARDRIDKLCLTFTNAIARLVDDVPYPGHSYKCPLRTVAIEKFHNIFKLKSICDKSNVKFYMHINWKDEIEDAIEFAQFYRMDARASVLSKLLDLIEPEK